MKKVILLTTFFSLTPIVLIVSSIYLSFLNFQGNNKGRTAFQAVKGTAYSALPSNQNVLAYSIDSQDARIEIVRNFFKKYNSDLSPFAETVVSNADKYGIDFRLIPAIAMQESNLCKKSNKDWHNCWGFGIYTNKLTTFDSYDEAINAVSKTLAKYKDNGLVTAEEIMTKYTPGSNGSWAFGVNHFMNALDLSTIAL